MNEKKRQYLLRAELIALHEASQAGGPQFYMSCAQITVTNTTSSEDITAPEGGTSFPGTYTSSTPGIVWNLYAKPPLDPDTYVAPGPAVWSQAGGGSIAQIGSASA